MPKTFIIRLDESIVNEVDSIAENMGLNRTRAVHFLLHNSIKQIKTHGLKIHNFDGELDDEKEQLLDKAKEAASRGTESLLTFLTALDTKQEQQLKYMVKMLREQAQEADQNGMAEGLQEYIAKGDDMCLRGLPEFKAWWDSLTKPRQAALKPYVRGWNYDANRVSSIYKKGERPAKRHWPIFKQQNNIPDSDL